MPAAAARLSGRKPPPELPLLAMHPVRCGFTAFVHAPASVDGAVGGSGSSVTLIGSGRGGAGTPVGTGVLEDEDAVASGPAIPPLAMSAAAMSKRAVCDRLILSCPP